MIDLNNVDFTNRDLEGNDEHIRYTRAPETKDYMNVDIFKARADNILSEVRDLDATIRDFKLQNEQCVLDYLDELNKYSVQW